MNSYGKTHDDEQNEQNPGPEPYIDKTHDDEQNEQNPGPEPYIDIIQDPEAIDENQCSPQGDKLNNASNADDGDTKTSKLPMSKTGMAKLAITLICIGLLIAQFSTTISDLHNINKLLLLAEHESNEHITNVLQKGSAYCFINNITKVLVITCQYDGIINMKSFTLGTFNFSACAFP